MCPRRQRPQQLRQRRLPQNQQQLHQRPLRRVTTPAATPAAPASAPAAKKASAQQAPPANSAGTVWVNTDSGVYHKPGTRWYGKTKQGKYMIEADAQKAGYRAAAKE
jgi:hypothetical protein